jgi:hypothetical protein
MNRARNGSCLLCGVLALSCLACGKGRLPVNPVHGRLLVDGQPAAHAQVAFHPVGNDGPEAVHPFGQVDDRGEFTLSSYVRGDGAPEGDYKVTVAWYLATPNPDRDKGGDDFLTVNYLSDDYVRVETSPLRVRISKGANELAPFELSKP